MMMTAETLAPLAPEADAMVRTIAANALCGQVRGCITRQGWTVELLDASPTTDGSAVDFWFRLHDRGPMCFDFEDTDFHLVLAWEQAAWLGEPNAFVAAVRQHDAGLVARI